MKTGKKRYICPEIEVVEINVTCPLATSNELNIDSSQQGEEEEDFALRRDNNRGTWGNLWGGQ